jgi:hypothetical protein
MGLALTFPEWTVGAIYVVEISVLLLVLIQQVRVFTYFPTIKALQRRRLAYILLVLAFTIEASWFGTSNVGRVMFLADTAWMREPPLFVFFKGFGALAAGILFWFFYIDRAPKKEKRDEE